MPEQVLRSVGSLKIFTNYSKSWHFFILASSTGNDSGRYLKKDVALNIIQRHATMHWGVTGPMSWLTIRLFTSISAALP